LCKVAPVCFLYEEIVVLGVRSGCMGPPRVEGSLLLRVDDNGSYVESTVPNWGLSTVWEKRAWQNCL
jgi:hypothetical protein